MKLKKLLVLGKRIRKEKHQVYTHRQCIDHFLKDFTRKVAHAECHNIQHNWNRLN